MPASSCELKLSFIITGECQESSNHESASQVSIASSNHESTSQVSIASSAVSAPPENHELMADVFGLPTLTEDVTANDNQCAAQQGSTDAQVSIPESVLSNNGTNSTLDESFMPSSNSTVADTPSASFKRPRSPSPIKLMVKIRKTGAGAWSVDQSVSFITFHLHCTYGGLIRIRLIPATLSCHLLPESQNDKRNKRNLSYVLCIL